MKNPLWVIRAGEKRQAHDLLISHGRIVLIEPGLGNLLQLEPTRDAFLSAYRTLRPNDSPSGSATIAKGNFFRFVHDMKREDTVLYLSVKERHVYVGTVTGDYMYDLSFSVEYPHQRTVTWKFVFPMTELSESARGEFGAARSFYMYQRHVSEVLTVINGDKSYSFLDWMNRSKRHISH
jgi:predicted Mrr-cat superfamily restriction endonuclease